MVQTADAVLQRPGGQLVARLVICEPAAATLSYAGQEWTRVRRSVSGDVVYQQVQPFSRPAPVDALAERRRRLEEMAEQRRAGQRSGWGREPYKT